MLDLLGPQCNSSLPWSRDAVLVFILPADVLRFTQIKRDYINACNLGFPLIGQVTDLVAFKVSKCVFDPF